METCADCGKPIKMTDQSYYRKAGANSDIGQTFHAGCGDLFKCKTPHLGLATTRELLDELRARVEMHALGGLDYRTVDGEKFAEARLFPGGGQSKLND